MTTREFLNSIISTKALSADVRDHAKDELAKLDARNVKRASTPSKTAVANEPIKAQIAQYLADKGAVTSPDVGAAVGISTQKASALLRQMVEGGLLTSEEVKVPKKGKVKAYRVVR